MRYSFRPDDFSSDEIKSFLDTYGVDQFLTEKVKNMSDVKKLLKVLLERSYNLDPESVAIRRVGELATKTKSIPQENLVNREGLQGSPRRQGP